MPNKDIKKEAKKSKSSNKARPQNLGTGGARKAANAIVARKKLLDSI